MHQNRDRVMLSLMKTQSLLACCAAVLVLGWTVTSEGGGFSKEKLSAAMLYAHRDSANIPKLLAAGKDTLVVAQKGGALSKKPVQRSVIINRVPLSDEKIKALEQLYGIRILNGDYWYDKVCGAWGFRGGPAVGFIIPYLDLGGPLQPDASNGNTGVFINGRQLHVLDVLALQQIGPVYQGRYWVNAQGYFGFEGGRAIGNFWMLANSRGVKREGILSTYDKTGVAVIGN